MSKSNKAMVGVLQMTSTGDVDANMDAVQRLVREAADRGAQLVLVPECFSYLGPEKGKVDNPGHKYPFADETLTTGIREATLTGDPYPVKGWLVYATNLLNALPNEQETIRAIENLDLLVVVDVVGSFRVEGVVASPTGPVVGSVSVSAPAPVANALWASGVSERPVATAYSTLRCGQWVPNT